MVYVWLILGFVLLIKGADFFVDGSSSIARIFKIPSIIVGLTIVAMGTSAPEAAVSITAAIKGANALSLSNVIGSNFFNLFVVVGLCAVIKPMKISKDILKRDFPICIISTVLLAVMCIIGPLLLGHIDGAILLVLFAIYIYILIKVTMKNRKNDVATVEEEEIKVLSPFISILFIILGIAGIVIGGDLVVNSASDIAASFGISQHIIGLTIVAIGTSLPELVTSLVASKKGENELALGNVIGSNIFNILLILGLSSAISPITVSIISIYDLIILIVLTLFTFIYVAIKKNVGRIGGIVMLLSYALYMAYILIR